MCYFTYSSHTSRVRVFDLQGVQTYPRFSSFYSQLRGILQLRVSASTRATSRLRPFFSYLCPCWGARSELRWIFTEFIFDKFILYESYFLRISDVPRALRVRRVFLSPTYREFMFLVFLRFVHLFSELGIFAFSNRFLFNIQMDFILILP